MTKTLKAIYEGGVFRPIEPVELSEQEEVLITVRDHSTAQSTETVYDRFQQAGLIGMLEDAPADLSTNPKHMEGFATE